jgi:hypothetical protein
MGRSSPTTSLTNYFLIALVLLFCSLSFFSVKANEEFLDEDEFEGFESVTGTQYDPFIGGEQQTESGDERPKSVNSKPNVASKSPLELDSKLREDSFLTLILQGC